METLRSVVLVICAMSILSGIFSALKPNARFDRQMRLILSAVFLLAILSAVTGNMDDWELSLAEGDEISGGFADAATVEVAAENLAQTLEAYLETQGFLDTTVEVEMHIIDTGSIEIEQILVSAPDTETAAAAESALAAYLGN